MCSRFCHLIQLKIQHFCITAQTRAGDIYYWLSMDFCRVTLFYLLPFVYGIQQDTIKTTLSLLACISYKWFGVRGNHSITIVICKIQYIYLT